jgi:hypothetical protein
MSEGIEMATPVDSDMVHVCEYLDYRGERIELAFPDDDSGRRWVLYDADGGVSMQVVLFCPYCGRDFRADCHWQIPGRPTENSILARARAAGNMAKRPKCICHGPDMIAGVCPVHGAPPPLPRRLGGKGSDG